MPKRESSWKPKLVMLSPEKMKEYSRGNIPPTFYTASEVANIESVTLRTMYRRLNAGYYNGAKRFGARVWLIPHSSVKFPKPTPIRAVDVE